MWLTQRVQPHRGTIEFIHLSTRVERLPRGKPLYALRTYFVVNATYCTKLDLSLRVRGEKKKKTG